MSLKVVEKKIDPDVGKGSDGAYYKLIVETDFGGRRELVVSRGSWEAAEIGKQIPESLP